MKKIAEKVALVAQICITLVFVLTTVLYMSNTIAQRENWSDNGVMGILMIVLAIVYLGISAYMLYVNFSENANLKRILLFCDSDSATRVSMKVVNNIVKGCANEVEGLKVRKTRIRSDEKAGLIATFYVAVTAENVSESVNKMRCLVEKSFENVLGLKFNSINFNVDRLAGKYVADASVLEKTESLAEEQAESAENYHEPASDVKEDSAE